MKKFVLGFTFVLALAMSAMAADVTGYISDAGCAKKQGAAKVASEEHAGCAQSCIKKGDKAVLVTDDGKILNVTNQDKVIDHAGQKVTVKGDIDGDNITVTEIKS
jgi:opacity protein-like surface antigen